MNHWTFIWSAYGLTFMATIGLLAHSLFTMRAAEADIMFKGDPL
mgnify:CR=1 FL=1